MEEQPKWYFPDHCVRAFGFNTTDMETFKKNPVSHFAREICQNSIDAHRKGDGPVKVVFKTFTIHKNNIPGVNDLKLEANACRNYTSDKNEVDYEIAQTIYDTIDNSYEPFIQCLRVSDFNTTGLYGVKSGNDKDPFFSLTKGSGSSNKNDDAAGSKGIGKYAAFVISGTNTVFYSTHAETPTKDIEDGYFGVAKLCSRPATTFNTFGEGYYGVGDNISPSYRQLYLDPNFSRTPNEFGTDLYIIGFNEKNWEQGVIKKILESFIVAIIHGDLEIEVANNIINKDTLKKYIDDIKSQDRLTKDDKLIVSQYDILTDLDNPNVHETTFKVNGDDIHLYAKVYPKNEADFATKKCVRVRYPYMKIDAINLNAISPVSAVCIIEKCDTGKLLRTIENPQHTEWEKNRVRDKKDVYEKVIYILEKFKIETNDFVADILKNTQGESVDFEGAGEYLPDEEAGENDSDVEIPTENDKTIVSMPSRRTYHIAGNKNESDDGGSPDTVHSSGKKDENGEFLGTPISEGGGETTPNPNPDPNPDPNPNKEEIDIYGPGYNPYLKHILSKNMRFRCMKPAGINTYNISFSANASEDDCEINIASIGDSNDTEKVVIESATINGKEVEVKHGRIVHFPIESGKDYNVSCKINRDDMFASKVEMYAYKK